MTPGSRRLIVRAAVSTSAQVRGCHGTGRPARRNSSEWYQIARVSVEVGTP